MTQKIFTSQKRETSRWREVKLIRAYLRPTLKKESIDECQNFMNYFILSKSEWTNCKTVVTLISVKSYIFSAKRHRWWNIKYGPYHINRIRSQILYETTLLLNLSFCLHPPYYMNHMIKIYGPYSMVDF